ncbi:MAG TPA: YbjN domain-containing protein [Xanthobacteraceae bacterium]|nr:YbjN domain-containing protein [Xanthobacteraceae bacterium]
MSHLDIIIDSRDNSLAIVEDIATTNDWTFERSGEDEVTILAKGQWTDYELAFTWMDDIEALHLACAFEMRVPEARRAETQRLVALINEQLWVGHFDVWISSGAIMYRQALLLPDGMAATQAQCEMMVAGALHACERYYTAFQFVVWAGKTAAEAMSAAMFDTMGEA